MTSTEPLGQVFKISKGKKAARVVNEPTAGTLPYIQIDEVRGTGPSKYVIDPKAVEVTEDDLCIVWDGANAGTVGYGVKGAIGSTVARMRLKQPERWEPRFLGRLLGSKFQELNDQAQARGATIPHVDKAKLEEIEFPKIDRDEQRRIAAILDKADAIRRKVESVHAMKSELVASEFNERFMGGSLQPVTIGQLLEDGFLLLHKDGNHGSNYPRKSEFGSDGVPFLTAKTISEISEIDGAQVQFLARSKASSLTIGRLADRDVLLAHNATVGPVCIYDGRYDEAIIGTSLTAFRCNEEVLWPEFLEAALRHPSFQQQLFRQMSQTTRNQVPITAQRQLKIIVPPIKQQKEFAKVVNKVSALSGIANKQRLASAALFASLSQRAFRGEL